MLHCHGRWQMLNPQKDSLTYPNERNWLLPPKSVSSRLNQCVLRSDFQILNIEQGIQKIIMIKGQLNGLTERQTSHVVESSYSILRPFLVATACTILSKH